MLEIRKNFSTGSLLNCVDSTITTTMDGWLPFGSSQYSNDCCCSCFFSSSSSYYYCYYNCRITRPNHQCRSTKGSNYSFIVSTSLAFCWICLFYKLISTSAVTHTHTQFVLRLFWVLSQNTAMPGAHHMFSTKYSQVTHHLRTEVLPSFSVTRVRMVWNLCIRVNGLGLHDWTEMAQLNTSSDHSWTHTHKHTDITSITSLLAVFTFTYQCMMLVLNNALVIASLFTSVHSNVLNPGL